MHPWIWIQSVLRKLRLPGYTVFDPIAVETEPRLATGTREFAPQFGFWSVYPQPGRYTSE